MKVTINDTTKEIAVNYDLGDWEYLEKEIEKAVLIVESIFTQKQIEAWFNKQGPITFALNGKRYHIDIFDIFETKPIEHVIPVGFHYFRADIFEKIKSVLKTIGVNPEIKNCFGVKRIELWV